MSWKGHQKIKVAQSFAFLNLIGQRKSYDEAEQWRVCSTFLNFNRFELLYRGRNITQAAANRSSHALPDN